MYRERNDSGREGLLKLAFCVFAEEKGERERERETFGAFLAMAALQRVVVCLSL